MYISNSTGGLMLQTMLYLANQTSRAAVNTLVDLPPAQKSDGNEVKCYGVYGCFPLNGPWTTETRQINVHPQKPSQIEPHYTLYTKRSMEKPKFIDLNDPEAVAQMGINPAGKIFLVSHGYLENGNIEWMKELAKTLLQSEDEGNAAVILIDWGGGSNPPYVQAAANIRLVGAITAHVIHMLYEELQLPHLRNVHIIGHSLGSHLAGYAGYHLQQDFGLKLGRITGLDPAAPLFSETEHIVRLDRSDAEFVDAIHTDANPFMKGGLGIYQRVGHVDFYPNGGSDNPGCDVRLQDYMRSRKSSVFLSMQEFLSCNHIRSYQYFTESIENKCPFMGITCESYEAFKEGLCSRCDENGLLCMRMGLHSYTDYKELQAVGELRANDKPPVLYLTTADKKPFCRIHYKITVRVSGHDESTMHGGEIGTISLRLHSKTRSKKLTDHIRFSEKAMYFEPGFEYSALVTGKGVPDPASYASVYWEYQTNFLNPLTWRILSAPRIYLDYIMIESLEYPDMQLKLCPLNENAVISGTENILQEKYCK
ncbi:pancreatic lipase-related protein 2 [Bactrocera neohumeralis]|uniref:pancreatic lipase-related protein 2-like n=1 Tax=Bactrocera tryoni TaxID=59916 RepID=UPI001A99F5F3|nr:pancreatic lipase-related protein 2-like [Bactrocera tryoni]XP_050329619.1 pancreatic lipase-related protein 2 [Bactrocera neohumeralis]